MVALALGLAACGDDEPSPERDHGGDGSPTATQTKSSTVQDDAEDVAALEELHADFWDARIRSFNGPSVDPDLYDGLATTGFAESQLLGYVQSELVARDARRDGRPTLSDVTVTLNGDKAVIDSCLDTSEWRFLVGGEEVPIDLGEPEPSVLQATRTPDGWLMERFLPTRRSNLTC